MKAGEEPLCSNSEEDMDVEDGGAVGQVLVQTAQDAYRIVDDNGPQLEKEKDRDRSNPKVSQRVRPKLDTKISSRSNVSIKSEDLNFRDEKRTASGSQHRGLPEVNKSSRKPKDLDESPFRVDHSSTKWSNDSPSRKNSDLTSMSKKLRQYTIPTSKGSPMETLPPMKSSSPSQLSKSPNTQNRLPPLYAQLGSLADGPPGFSPINSPPSLNPRAPIFTSAPNHMHGPSQAPLPPTQPSPTSAYTTSPSERYRRSGSMSTASPKMSRHQRYYSSARTPQSEGQTPLSADSHNSSTTELSSTSDVPIDKLSRTLPPLPNTLPFVNGTYNCEHPGCTAVPFQTQYLLK